MALAYAQDDDVDSILSQSEKMVMDVTEQQNKAGFRTSADVALETFELIEANSKTNDRVTGLATGYQELDLLTTGFQPDQLIILAARPGMGKTAFALNIAQNVATKSDTSVALFSLEMGATDLMSRMLCAEGNINSQNLRTGNLDDAEWDQLVMAMTELSKAEIFIDDTPGIKVNEIRAKCRKLKQTHDNLGLVIIDYLQLIEGDGKEGRQQQVSEISRNLKKLAKELSAPVIALSQLSRAVESREDKRPMLSDLRESGSIEQDADIVSFLYREDYYAKAGGERDEDGEEVQLDDSIEVILEKNRAGQRGTATLLFKKEFNKFANRSYRSEDEIPPY
jgi:replicative DNA helicase